jgi:RNA polymerase sigma-70 factor (ECF subfamily)
MLLLPYESANAHEPATMMYEERRIIDEAATDRQERFLGLLDPVHDSLCRFVRGMTRDREEARDLTAETILVAFENFGSLRDGRAFLSYLFTIARRICRHRTHRARLFGRYDEGFAAKLVAQGSPPDAAADVPALYAALDRLPAGQREAVVLFELSGLSLEEVREIQGGTLSGVKARVARGRRKLAELLGVEEPSPTITPTAPVISPNRNGTTLHGEDQALLYSGSQSNG